MGEGKRDKRKGSVGKRNLPTKFATNSETYLGWYKYLDKKIRKTRQGGPPKKARKRLQRGGEWEPYNKKKIVGTKEKNP